MSANDFCDKVKKILNDLNFDRDINGYINEYYRFSTFKHTVSIKELSTNTTIYKETFRIKKDDYTESYLRLRNVFKNELRIKTIEDFI